MHQLAQYLKEREGFDSIINDAGFATYKISGDECYIRDIWITPECRERHMASDIADLIAGVAKRAGCKYLTGSVMPSANNSTASTKVLLAYGFHIHSAVTDGIYFRKDL